MARGRVNFRLIYASPILNAKGPRHLNQLRHQGLPLRDAVSMLDIDSFFNLFFPLLAL